ncbi:CBN-SRU-3 protein [Caenorhabditis brenneri]|uniref:CBN-SRU-3 protein n=1 Tax=Caenorhabditis brenneri TaxID=135651 RepID=G0PDA4_CAEBE|nr:CBN-SRU-3 protein [Caenorhabditis brenneri]
MVPSFIVICKIFNIYLKSSPKKPEYDVNRHVFLAISLSQFACFASFFFDYFMTRLPATGIFTSFCASIAPNHYLKVVLFLALYTNYLSLAFPILMPLIRLVVVLFPKSHKKLNSKLIRIIVPLICLYPICFTFYLIPALGVCKSYEYPYPFGAIWIYYTNSAFGLRNSYFHLGSIFFWMSISIVINAVLLFKVIKAKALINGGQSYKAEFSITLTTLAIIVFYVLNAVFVINQKFIYIAVPIFFIYPICFTFYFIPALGICKQSSFPYPFGAVTIYYTQSAFGVLYISFAGGNAYVAYGEVVRPFGNDLQTCVTTWLFYLTHPVFKKPSGGVGALFSSSSQKTNTKRTTN